MNDTHLATEQFQTQRRRSMPPARRLEMVRQMNQTARALALSGLCQRFPNDTAAWQI